MTVAITVRARVGRLSDFRALGALYSSRSESDRQVFHPFPEGRRVSPLVILLLLVAQRLFPLLVRLRPTLGFVFVVFPGGAPGTVDGFVYLRVRRRTSKGYVANIGTQVGPQARGKGVGPQLISALIVEARRRGVWRIETDFYEQNTASRRMGEKLGFRIPDDPAEARRPGPHGVIVTHILDLDEVTPPPPGPESKPPPPTPPTGEVPGPEDSTAGPVETSKGSARQRAVTWVALFAAFAVIAFLRLALLFAHPYPSSGDVAEQLYWSHIWLGTAFPSPVTVWWIPPVYIFTVYIPFTHLFPLFTGQRLLMGVVPALLVFPAYLLLRESSVSRGFALFGGSLLALAPPFSLMLTWNAGFNLFGMFWALLFFAGLTGTLRTHRRGYILLTGVAFGLTAGAHDFTFLFVCLGFGLIAVLAFILLPLRARTARSLGWVLGAGLLSAAPFALVYLTLASQTSNVGGAVTPSALNTLAQQFLPFTWGAQNTWSSLLVLDSALSLLAVGALVVARRGRPETPVLLGILLSGVILSVAYPQVADRGLYFLPLGFYPVVAILFQMIYDRLPPRPSSKTPAPAGSPGNAPPEAPRRRTRATRRTRPGNPRGAWVKPVVAAVVVVAFLAVNAQQSLVALSSGEKYYVGLVPQDVPALDWLAHFTAPNASVFSSESVLEKWIWGYSNRQAYAPTPLNLQATTLSYQNTYLSDLATLGQYVVGNPYLAVAQNSPAPVGEPLVYVHTAYYWSLMFSTAANNVNFTVAVGGVPQELSLATAQLVSNSTLTPCSGCLVQQLLFSWPSIGVSIRQQTNLSGETVNIGWVATGGILSSVSLTTLLVPSSFGIGYVNVQNQTGANVSSLTDSFSLSGAPFTATLSGTNTTVQQIGVSGGWTQVEFDGGPNFTIAFQGLSSAAPTAPVSADSGTILRGLGVSYVLADRADSVPGFGFLMYLRCDTPDEIPGITASIVFQSGSLFIFKLTPS